MEFKKQVIAKPVPNKLSLLKKFLSFLPYRCKYCGKKYVDCHSEEINLFFPLSQNGKCCPDGHCGYIKKFIGIGYTIVTFDNVGM